jgi:hypothetical protein
MTNDEIQNYDLSTTGTIVELTDTSSHDTYGFLIEATASVDFVVEVSGGTVGAVQVDLFSASSVSSGFEGPEVVDIRIRNTTTAAAGETADAILGSGGR